ncbi:hypothetical protein Clacol_009860 [Clathrus columnatus]|uniref:Uncharacterized protein n=1 Tax=Clathrus columnatus TaxID=1419009 RepID=A0AAV5AP80_9AGAM|nr:hypothetical protein Clacol_009860 [Clathrus columnatus]
MSGLSIVDTLVDRTHQLVLGSTKDSTTFLGNNEEDRAQIHDWIRKANEGRLTTKGDLNFLESHLLSRTFLVQNRLTAADVAVYAALYPIIAKENSSEHYSHPAVTRYFDHVQSQPDIRAAVKLTDPTAFSFVEIDLENAPKQHRASEAPKKKGDKVTKAPTSANTPVTHEKKEAVPKDKEKEEKTDRQKKESKEKKVGSTATRGNKETAGKGGGGNGVIAAENAAPVPSMIDLRVGHIVDGEETGPRTVVSGLVNYIPIEQMRDKWLIVVCNLKPASMRGVKSHAMVLCATHKNGKEAGIEIVDPPKGSKPGDRVYFEGPYEVHVTDDLPLEQLNPKKKIFETIQPGFTTLESREAAWVDPVTKTKRKASVEPGTGNIINSKGYVADTSVGPMLQYEKSLPRLPVPSLASTAAKYLETVQPHVTTEAYAKTRRAVEQFIASEQGKELQRRLEARATEPDRANWLIDWWNDSAYMGYRDPVVVYVSYFYVHLDDKTIKTPAKRAATLIKALLPFKELVETQQLEPDTVRNVPIAMSSYEWLFNSCRYPMKPSDTAKKFNPQTNQHVIFIRNNKFFEVPITQDGQTLSTLELEAQINKVIEFAKNDKAIPVGALTSETRDIWTNARQALIAASPVNAISLERIESAIIVVALDDRKPITREDISWQCWEFMLAFLKSNKIDHGTSLRQLPPPRELKFELDSTVKQYISQAEKDFDELVNKHELLLAAMSKLTARKVLHYEGYGKETIKKFKASPDAWVQLVKQLAFHKLYNRPGVCYESCQTRKFQFGRTEVIRSASKESKGWAEAMLDPHQSDIYRAALFRKAVSRHLQYAAWAADGQGVDRHLFGLKKLIRVEETIPEIYRDESYSRTNHWELSTSQLSSPFLDGWGYGEVVPDGYGLSYAIGDNYLRWTITSLKLNTAELRHCLAEAATETKEMLERATVAAANKL